MAHAIAPATVEQPPRTAALGVPLLMAWVLWWTFAAISFGTFSVAAVLRFAELREPCDAANQRLDCGFYVLTSNQAGMLADLGVSLGVYAAFQIAIEAIPALVYLGIGVLMMRQRRADRLVLVTSLALVAVGFVMIPETTFALERAYPDTRFLLASLFVVALPAFIYMIATFPNGRFEPRWMRWHALAATILILIPVLLDLFAPTGAPRLMLLGSVILWLPLFYGQVHRYRFLYTLEERQQVKWVLYGLACFLVSGMAWLLLFGLDLASSETTQLWLLLTALPALLLSATVLPVTFAIAIMQRHLYDIEIVLNRTLVYGILSALVIGLYVAIVGGLGNLIHGESSALLPFVAVGAIAVLIQLARDRIQRAANRLMFGGRDEPYALLARLGHELSVTSPPDHALQHTVETVASTLKLPYAGIELRDGAGFAPGAAHGTPIAEPVIIPLLHQGETVGRLLVSPRSLSERFTRKERQLLDDIAHQAGAVTASVRLTRVLQQARERLVLAREEERRRIRRDLHDGLGPTLAVQTLRLDAAIDMLPDDPKAAQRALLLIKQQNTTLIGDIRRLVYELRPPALDELHLAGAIRSHAMQLAGDQRLCIDVRSEPDPMPDLPAAVEVAAYRVIEEALTNFVRHANATECHVRLTIEPSPRRDLALEVADNGVGLPEHPRAGIGLRSMRERVEELGGALVIGRRQEGGTRLQATFPLGLATHDDGEAAANGG